MVKKLGFLFILAFTAFAMVNCNRSSGGKNPPASSDMFALSFQHDAIERVAWIHVPENYDSTTALPVVLNFHGYGGYATAHAATTGMRATSDSFQFLLVYPQEVF